MPETDLISSELNPIDSVEEIMTDNNWSFDRMNNDELIVEVKGKNCNYRLFFVWQEDMNALQFGCHYNIDFSPYMKEQAKAALPRINENLWLGHFDLPVGGSSPIFRYTCLFCGINPANITETVENLMDVALAQCESHFPAFHVLANAPSDLREENLSLALMETVGRS